MIAELRALLTKATPQHWEVAGSGYQVCESLTTPDPMGFNADRSNAALIVAAVNAMPALLDVAEAAKRVRSEKRAFTEGIHRAELGGRMPDSKGLSEADEALFAALNRLRTNRTGDGK